MRRRDAIAHGDELAVLGDHRDQRVRLDYRALVLGETVRVEVPLLDGLEGCVSAIKRSCVKGAPPRR
jgi:hypothetical protein